MTNNNLEIPLSAIRTLSNAIRQVYGKNKHSCDGGWDAQAKLRLQQYILDTQPFPDSKNIALKIASK